MQRSTDTTLIQCKVCALFLTLVLYCLCKQAFTITRARKICFTVRVAEGPTAEQRPHVSTCRIVYIHHRPA